MWDRVCGLYIAPGAPGKLGQFGKLLSAETGLLSSLAEQEAKPDLFVVPLIAHRRSG